MSGAKRRDDRGTVMMSTVAMVAAIAFTILIYHEAAIQRTRAVDTQHNLNRAFNLAEVALNEAIHQLNLGTDGIDNDGDGTVDDTDEWNASFGTTGWTSADDDGLDGSSGTSDRGEGDGVPTFGEANVVPIASANGEYYAYTIDWEADGVDNNNNGSTDAADPLEVDHYQIHAFGREGGGGQIYWVEVVTTAENVNVWNNAIFAGDGGAGTTINGNVTVHGSIHILGDNLADTDPALDLSGTSGQRNDYSDISATLQAKIPALAAGADLNAKLRVKQGYVGLSGNAEIGESTLEVDGVYVTDGFGGTSGEDNVFSANGIGNQYDLPDGTVTFPEFADAYTDPSTGITYANYKTFFTTTSLHVPAMTINKDTATFSVGPDTDGNSFSYNSVTKQITMNGKITFDGNLTLGSSIPAKNIDITYDGKASILAQQNGADAGNIVLHGDVLPAAGQTFPTGSVLGLMAENNLDLPSNAQKTLAAAFYAQNKLSCTKQNMVAGTFVANEVDMGMNVPDIYQVPSLVDNLPPGMIGGGSIILFTRLSWREH